MDRGTSRIISSRSSRTTRSYMLYLSDVLGSFLFGTRTVGLRVALLGAPPRVEAEGFSSWTQPLSAREASELLDGDWLTSDRLSQSLSTGDVGEGTGLSGLPSPFFSTFVVLGAVFLWSGPTSFGPDLSLPPNRGGLVVFTTLVELVFFDRIADRISLPQYPSSSRAGNHGLQRLLREGCRRFS